MADENKICTCTTPEYTINLEKQGPSGVKGDTGENGFSPVITVAQNTLSNYSLNILTADGMVVTPNLKANLPAGGATGQVLTKNSGTQDDCSWQNLPNATAEVEGIARLATETDFETTEDSAVSDTSIVTPALFNSELKAQVGSYIVAGDNITTSVGEDGKVTINAEAEPYTLPQANATTLGGVKADPITDEDTQAVNIDPATGLLYTKAGGGVTDAYTKAETDELLDAKQDILTPVQPLTLQNKIISNLEGMEYTSDGLGVYTTDINNCSGVFNNTGYTVLGDNICLCKQANYATTDWGDSVIPSKIIIPYTFGQIIKFPCPNSNNPGFAFWGYNTSVNCYYPIFNPTEEDKVSVQTVGTFLDRYGFTFGRTSVTKTGSSSTVPNASNIAYAQLTRNTSSFTLVVFYPQGGGTGRLIRAKYEITSNFSKLNEITSFIITPTTSFTVGGNAYGTSESNPIPISSIGLYEYSGDFSILENPESVLTDNLFDLSGQTAKNYLEVQVDGTTITTNSSGQLQANIPSNLTTQGNIFNGASQLVQLDGDGKLPAIDGSQLTNLQTGNPSDAYSVTTLTSGASLNSLTTEGLYFVDGGSNFPNGVSATRGFVRVEKLNYPDWSAIDGSLVQSFTTVNSLSSSTPPDVYTRFRTKTSFSPWVKVNTTLPTITTPVNTLLKIDTTGLNTSVANGATQNLLDLVSLTGSGTNVVTVANILATNYDLTGGILKLPYLPTVNSVYTNAYCDYTIDVRLTGTIAGATGSNREFAIELQRGADNSLVERRAVVKVNGTDLASRATAFNTYTNTSTDPFISGGLKLILNNNSGQTITLTGITILVKGRSY